MLIYLVSIEFNIRSNMLKGAQGVHNACLFLFFRPAFTCSLCVFVFQSAPSRCQTFFVPVVLVRASCIFFCFYHSFTYSLVRSAFCLFFFLNLFLFVFYFILRVLMLLLVCHFSLCSHLMLIRYCNERPFSVSWHGSCVFFKFHFNSVVFRFTKYFIFLSLCLWLFRCLILFGLLFFASILHFLTCSWLALFLWQPSNRPTITPSYSAFNAITC